MVAIQTIVFSKDVTIDLETLADLRWRRIKAACSGENKYVLRGSEPAVAVVSGYSNSDFLLLFCFVFLMLINIDNWVLTSVCESCYH